MIIEGSQLVYSLGITGATGRSGGYGLARHGNARYGYYTPLAGIYQRRKTLQGIKISRAVVYRPSNPQTVPQQAWRAVFAAGVSAYHALTPTQKSAYTKLGNRRGITGYNFFLKKYLQTH